MAAQLIAGNVLPVVSVNDRGVVVVTVRMPKGFRSRDVFRMARVAPDRVTEYEAV